MLIILKPSFLLVYADGSICLDILQNRWSPTYDVSSILTSIQVIEANSIQIYFSRELREKMPSVECPATV